MLSNKMQRINKVLTDVHAVCNFARKNNVWHRLCSTTNTATTTTTTTNNTPTNELLNEEESKSDSKVNRSGFAKAFAKHENLMSPQNKDNVSFAELLRFSKFIDLGNPVGKIVTGRIYHVTGNDLYIDFGWKFHCVCQKPMKNSEGYIKDAIVRLKIKDLELSSLFLGSEKELTLLEADCTLLGLVTTPFGSNTTSKPLVHESLNKN